MNSLEIANKVEHIISYADKKTLHDKKQGLINGTIKAHRDIILLDQCNEHGISFNYVLKFMGADF